MKRKRALSLMLTICMVFGLIPVMRLTAIAAEGIPYVNAAGEDMGSQSCIHVNTNNTNWSEGWYALTTSLYFTNTIYVNGTVNLILCDNPNNPDGKFTLDATKGIVLNPGSHLIIWAQSRGTGKIDAMGGEEHHPGIGNYAPYDSGNLTINGVNISASGGKGAPGLGSCGSNSGIITINGGSVYINGGHDQDGNFGAPGIGASNMSDSSIGTMNDIYFYGGTTQAYANGTESYPPIGDSTNSTGTIHLASGMKTVYANLENGRLTDYHNGRVEVKQEDGAGPAYTVGTNYNANFGTVTTSVPMARLGDKFTVTTTPNDDCYLVGLTVTDREGTEITENDDGTYTMPASSVTVNAVFHSIYYGVTVNTVGSGSVTLSGSDTVPTTA